MKSSTEILRQLVAAFPQVGTDEPINGADAVDRISQLVLDAREALQHEATWEDDLQAFMDANEYLAIYIDAHEGRDAPPAAALYDGMFEAADRAWQRAEDVLVRRGLKFAVMPADEETDGGQ